MTTDNHTAISNGAAANASTFNAPLAEIDAAIGDLSDIGSPASAVAAVAAYAYGGASVGNRLLMAWVDAGAYELTSITYDSTYTTVISTATVKWPDGTGGTFTTDTINTTWEAIDAYHITHTPSSKTVTQTAVTRNSDGNITAKPAITVA